MTQLALHFPVETSYRDEDFLVADCNKEAWDALQQWQQTPYSATQNSFLLRGESASGKTHLATLWARAKQAAILSAESLARETQPDTLFAQQSALVVENAEKSPSQEALFHLLNHAKQHEVKLLLTANDTACWQAFTLPDLRSRLQALPQAIIHSPDEAILAALLVKSFKDRQLEVSSDLIHYLIHRIDRSYSSAQYWVKKLDERAIERKKPITIALARSLLTDS